MGSVCVESRFFRHGLGVQSTEHVHGRRLRVGPTPTAGFNNRCPLALFNNPLVISADLNEADSNKKIL